jgi:hypothetical protein
LTLSASFSDQINQISPINFLEKDLEGINNHCFFLFLCGFQNSYIVFEDRNTFVLFLTEQA